MNIKIGDTLYYEKRLCPTPIKQQLVIDDQSRISWKCYKLNINKKTLRATCDGMTTQYYTLDGWNNMIESEELRDKIKNSLYELDLNKLRAIAEMVAEGGNK